MLWDSSSRRSITSVAVSTSMQAGKATLACFLPAGNTVTLEDETVTNCLFAAQHEPCRRLQNQSIGESSCALPTAASRLLKSLDDNPELL